MCVWKPHLCLRYEKSTFWLLCYARCVVWFHICCVDPTGRAGDVLVTVPKISVATLLFIFDFSLCHTCVVSSMIHTEWSLIFPNGAAKIHKIEFVGFARFRFPSLSLPFVRKKVIYFKWLYRWYCNFVFITFYCFCFLHTIFYFGNMCMLWHNEMDTRTRT